MKGNLIRYNTTSRKYINIPTRIGIMEGLQNWCILKILNSLDLVMSRFI